MNLHPEWIAVLHTTLLAATVLLLTYSKRTSADLLICQLNFKKTVDRKHSGVDTSNCNLVDVVIICEGSQKITLIKKAPQNTFFILNCFAALCDFSSKSLKFVLDGQTIICKQINKKVATATKNDLFNPTRQIFY